MPNLQSRRLLSYVPSKYGKISCWTHTVDCLVAKVRQTMKLSGRTCPDALYVEALRAV